MRFEEAEAIMKEFKQSLNACRGHCTIYTDRLHVESDVGYMALLAHAEIGSVFKESAIVDLELRGETWYVNGRRFDIDDLKEVLVTEFARFQLATLQVANALELRCRQHKLRISYGTAHNPDRQTVAINVFSGDTMQFKVCVHKNTSISASARNATIYDSRYTTRNALSLGGLLFHVDKFFETPGFIFGLDSTPLEQQETAALWHAVGKLSSMLDKMM